MDVPPLARSFIWHFVFQAAFDMFRDFVLSVCYRLRLIRVPGNPTSLDKHRLTFKVVVYTCYFIGVIATETSRIIRVPNFYQELGVQRANLDEQLRPAYRALLVKHHPRQGTEQRRPGGLAEGQGCL